MLKRFKGEYINIPNILSYARIILIPIIVWSFFSLEEYKLSALLVAISGLTDCVDGFIARHFNMVTDFGKIIDPLADKLTQITIIACLSYRFPLMMLLVGVLVIKELCIVIMAYFVMKRTDNVEGSRWYGKVSTILFYLVMIILLAFNPSPVVAEMLILCCLAGIVLALVLYVIRYSLILSNYNKISRR